jgi:hypothetical protein
MRTTYIIASILIPLQFILNSCDDEFLEVDPKATQIESNYYKNPEEAFNGLVAAYDPIGWEGASSGGPYATFACLVAASDEAYGGGGSSSDVWYLQVMNNYSLLDPANGPQMGYWEKGFTGIYRVNVLLTKLDEGVPGLAEEIKRRYIAEVKVLRAYYYFELIRLFRNLPLITRNMSTDELYNLTQIAPEGIYAQIEQDLKDAIAEPALPDMVPAAEEGGRMTKGIAYALLGKVYLYQEKWSQAAQELRKVNGTPGETSSFGYRLVDDFKEIFRPDNQFHSESILEISHTSSAASGWGNTSRVEGLVASTMFGPRSYNGPEYYSGWGGCPITPEFYNLMRGDPRFKATINDVDSLVDEGVASYVPGYLNTGYFVQKYAPLVEFENMGAGPRTLNYPQNYIEIRLADTYLMEAEALVQSGGEQTRADALLNAVRSRVGLAPVAATLENIYEERRIELATEGHRWYDLVRTGRAATVLASKGFTAGKNEVLPIPLEELNNTRLRQNPNY